VWLKMGRGRKRRIAILRMKGDEGI
jgi:hypothetical protein